MACNFNLGRRDEGAAGSLERGTAGSGDKGTLRGEMATGEAGRSELACAGEGWRDEPPPGATGDPTAAEKAAADLLSEQDLQAIDACILSHCADRFYKVARIMGRTEDELADRFPKLSYVFCTQRLNHLVDTGYLDAAGDVFKMRFSEVRLAHKKT